ncbi:MAG: 3-deoxy-manno-octulosonate cytidylyltransferase [Prevotella sp.]|nr:3-deoxy-manno-octulosonate cytidylyltransferase [Prevotella sp.]
MRFIGIIPARFASTRFPGKPLAVLDGKSVIERVYEQASQVLQAVYVATDDERIYDHVLSFGGKAVMTSAAHRSGTDRIAEAMTKVEGDWDVVVNIQGDEPFIRRSQIETLCQCFGDTETQIATLGKHFDSMEAVKNPNSPKIVTDNRGYALYFSRSAIPYVRGKDESEWLKWFPYLKHIGIYAYKTNVLKEITTFEPSPLEMAESLEQLRWLQNGYRIKVGKTDVETIGIDTPEDLRRAEDFLKAHRDEF